jgi:hypothetical protein
MNITNDNMMCNILTVLKRPKRGARGGKKGGKEAKKEEKYGDFSLGVIFLP